MPSSTDSPHRGVMALPAWSGPFTSSPWRDQSVGYARLVTGPFTSEGFASFTNAASAAAWLCGFRMRGFLICLKDASADGTQRSWADRTSRKRSRQVQGGSMGPGSGPMRNAQLLRLSSARAAAMKLSQCATAE
jgi:hypothetical protein